MANKHNRYQIRIYNEFFGKELTGEFIALTENTEPEEIIITDITVM
jgi:hypothetical protein